MKSAYSTAIGLLVFFPIYFAIDGAAALLMAGISNASDFALRFFVLTNSFVSSIVNIFAASVGYLAASAVVRRFANYEKDEHCLKVFVVAVVAISAVMAVYSIAVGVTPLPPIWCGLIVGMQYLRQHSEGR